MHTLIKPKRYKWACLIMALLIGVALLSSCKGDPVTEVFATGLNQPRGMTFDDAGNLYVAEAGMLDAQADNRSSPITNHSSQVTRISPDGQLTRVMDGLPFTHYAAAGDVGATDVAMLSDAVYVLTGEGYDDRLSRAMLRVAPDGSPELVANVFQFVEKTTPLDSAMGITTLASNPYSMVLAPDGDALYVTDGASGRVFHVTRDGAIRVFVELPNTPPLTGVTLGPDERIYFTLFSALPLARSNGAVWAADLSGRLDVAVPELTMPIDVGFDGADVMYVLEFSAGLTPDQFYAAASGRLLRVAQDGTQTVVLDRLNYPTAMTFSPVGDLYIAVSGAFSAPGQGAILKVPCHVLGTPDECPR